MEKDYKLCKYQHNICTKKLKSLSNLFKLKNKERLIDDYPVYVVEKYDKTPFILFGINPGYSYKSSV
jgi:hypothetical protein